MLSIAEAPSGFFDDDDEMVVSGSNSRVTVPIVAAILSPPKVSKPLFGKFNFGKFGSSKTTKTNQPDIPTVEKVVDLKTDQFIEVDEYPIYMGVKREYIYDESVVLNVSRNRNAVPDFTATLQQREKQKRENEQRELEAQKRREGESSRLSKEEQDAIDEQDVMNIMDNTVKFSLNDKSTGNMTKNEINDYEKSLDVITSNQFVEKKTAGIERGILPELLFSSLLVLFKYMNPEERGMILINMSFGGLIAGTKLVGPALKAASSEFPKLAKSFSDFVDGGKNPDVGDIYKKTLDAIINNGNRYRVDMSAKSQVINVNNFAKSVAAKGYSVHFPSKLLFTNPIKIKDETAKSIALSSVITVENLNEFFGSLKQSTQQDRANGEKNKKKLEEKTKADKKRGYVGKDYDDEESRYI